MGTHEFDDETSKRIKAEAERLELSESQVVELALTLLMKAQPPARPTDAD